MKVINAILCLSLALFINSGFAQVSGQGDEGFYERKAEGWFWYEVEPEPVEEKEPEELKPSPSAPQTKTEEGPKPFSTVWVRGKMESLKEKAIEDPTAENMRAYLYMQKTALDMSSRFADEYMLQVALDPNLDENSRRPISQFGGRAMTMQANVNKQTVLEKLSQKVGLWFFFASDCSYCHKQAPILQDMNMVYGTKTLAISLDNRPLSNTIFTKFVPDRGHAKKYDVSVTPTLMLVKKGEEPVKLSEGILSKSELIQRMLVVAKSKGWLNDDDFNSTLAYRNQLIDIRPGESNQIPSELDDPQELVNYIRSNIKGR